MLGDASLFRGERNDRSNARVSASSEAHLLIRARADLTPWQRWCAHSDVSVHNLKDVSLPAASITILPAVLMSVEFTRASRPDGPPDALASRFRMRRAMATMRCRLLTSLKDAIWARTAQHTVSKVAHRVQLWLPQLHV